MNESEPTKHEMVEKLQGLGVDVPTSWRKDQVQELYDEVTNPSSTEESDEDGPASPRG